MENVDAAVYSVQPLSLYEPGAGMRLVNANDHLYELRNLAEFQTRIYEDEAGQYTATVRKPVETDTPTDIFPEIRALATTISEEHGTALQPDAQQFYETVKENSDAYTHEQEPYTLHYNPEPQADSLPSTEPNENRALGGVTASMFGTIGAGMSAGDPAVGITVMLGGLGYSLWEMVGLTRRIPSPAASLVRWHKGRKVKKHKQGEHLTDDLVEDINRLTVRKTEVERELDGEDAYTLPDVEEQKEMEAERQELLDEETWDRFQQQLDINFHEFHELDGITATYTCGSYAGAATFLQTMTGEDISTDRPSLYTDADLFGDVFEAVPEEDKRTLLKNAIATETTEEVDAYAEEHDDLLQAVGQEATLYHADEEDPELTYDTLDAAAEEDAITFIADDMDVDPAVAEQIYRRFVDRNTGLGGAPDGST